MVFGFRNTYSVGNTANTRRGPAAQHGIGLAADKFFLSRPTAAAYQRAHSGKPLRHARPTGCAWLDRLRRLTGLPAVARADLLRVSAPEECRSTCLPKEWMLARCLGRGQWPKQPINILCLAANQFPEYLPDNSHYGKIF